MSADGPVPFRDPCDPAQTEGIFINHKTGETIFLPGAGCARFWIEFAFGKWLFPEMKGNDLDLLRPHVVDAAQKAFSVRFAQGCHWG
jgi:hypothetical protein